MFSKGGEYSHMGIASGIHHILKNSPLPCSDSLELQFNIDFLPLFKSSNMSIWPFLCLLKNVSSSGPYVVGLYSGPSKPHDVNEFLQEFVRDTATVIADGVEVGNRHYNIKIHSFVCDAPARAFIKCIKSHSGYSSCEKCTQHGEYMGKVIFLCVSSPLHTDIALNEIADEDCWRTLENLENLGRSPLLPLSMGLVSQFGLDYMHLVCLGVV